MMVVLLRLLDLLLLRAGGFQKKTIKKPEEMEQPLELAWVERMGRRLLLAASAAVARL